jgi:HEAT repeat protein
MADFPAANIWRPSETPRDSSGPPLSYFERNFAMNSISNKRTIIFLGAVLLLSFSVAAQDKPDQKLEQAIAVLRRVDVGNLNEQQKNAKAQEIDAAWGGVKTAGKTGVARLKQEIRLVDQNREKDDYFKLNASALLWDIGQFDEVDAIAAIWKTTPLNAQYKYVFHTAYAAARTQDRRALPLLLACLKDNDGRFDLLQHTTTTWLGALEIIWGAFGPQGAPELIHALETSTDPDELESAIFLLIWSHETKALPRIREIAARGPREARLEAIRYLGFYGHPQDYDFLIAGLRSTDPQETYIHVYALYEYEDLRAVPQLIPLLKADNEFFRREIIATLIHLLTPASLDALQNFCEEAGRNTRPDSQQNGECSMIDSKLKDLKIDLGDYASKSPREKADLIATMRKSFEEWYQLREDDKKLSRDQLIEAAQEWKTNGRIFGAKRFTVTELPKKDNTFIFRSNKYDWVEERHILSAATVGDIPLLLEVKTALCARLSEESLIPLEFCGRRLGARGAGER